MLLLIRYGLNGPERPMHGVDHQVLRDHSPPEVCCQGVARLVRCRVFCAVLRGFMIHRHDRKASTAPAMTV
jgi:hypothetical protein